MAKLVLLLLMITNTSLGILVIDVDTGTLLIEIPEYVDIITGVLTEFKQKDNSIETVAQILYNRFEDDHVIKPLEGLLIFDKLRFSKFKFQYQNETDIPTPFTTFETLTPHLQIDRIHNADNAMLSAVSFHDEFPVTIMVYAKTRYFTVEGFNDGPQAPSFVIKKSGIGISKDDTSASRHLYKFMYVMNTINDCRSIITISSGSTAYSNPTSQKVFHVNCTEFFGDGNYTLFGNGNYNQASSNYTTVFVSNDDEEPAEGTVIALSVLFSIVAILGGVGGVLCYMNNICCWTTNNTAPTFCWNRRRNHFPLLNVNNPNAVYASTTTPATPFEPPQSYYDSNRSDSAKIFKASPAKASTSTSKAKPKRPTRPPTGVQRHAELAQFIANKHSVINDNYQQIDDVDDDVTREDYDNMNNENMKEIDESGVPYATDSV